MSQAKILVNDSVNDRERKTVIRAESIRVLTGRIICEVHILDPRWHYSTPELMQVICQELPELPDHACVNERGCTFGDVLENTSLAHVLEHVAISLQVRSSHDPLASFQGTTEWTDEREGRARIQIGFQDDLRALRSFSEALTIINNAVILCSA